MSTPPDNEVAARVHDILHAAVTQVRLEVAQHRNRAPCTATRKEIEGSGWRDGICEMLESAIAQRMGDLARSDFYRLEHFIEVPPAVGPLRGADEGSVGVPQAGFRAQCSAFTVKVTREEAEGQRLLFHLGLIVAGASADETEELRALIAHADPESLADALKEFKHQTKELTELVEQSEKKTLTPGPYTLNTRRYMLKKTYFEWINSKFPLSAAMQWLAAHTQDEELPGMTLYIPIDMMRDVVHEQVFWAKHLFGAGALTWLWELATERCIQNKTLVLRGEDAPECPPLQNARIEMMVELDPDTEPPRHWIVRVRLQLGAAQSPQGPAVGAAQAPEANAQPAAGDVQAANAQPAAGANAQSAAGANAQPAAGANAQPTAGTDAQPTAGTDAQAATGPAVCAARRPRFGFQSKIPAIPLAEETPEVKSEPPKPSPLQ